MQIVSSERVSVRGPRTSETHHVVIPADKVFWRQRTLTSSSPLSLSLSHSPLSLSLTYTLSHRVTRMHIDTHTYTDTHTHTHTHTHTYTHAHTLLRSTNTKHKTLLHYYNTQIPHKIGRVS